MELHSLSMHPYYLKKRVWKFLYPDTFLNAVSTIHFYQHADPQRYLFRAVELDGSVCGFLECEKKTSSSAELSDWLGVNYWHRGIMQQAVRALCEEAFDTPVSYTHLDVYKRQQSTQQIMLELMIGLLVVFAFSLIYYNKAYTFDHMLQAIKLLAVSLITAFVTELAWAFFMKKDQKFDLPYICLLYTSVSSCLPCAEAGRF